MKNIYSDSKLSIVLSIDLLSMILIYCFNLDTVKTGGSMAVQCAALGMLNIGGVQDSNEILFPNTASARNQLSSASDKLISPL